jgi:hypothetical protein
MKSGMTGIGMITEYLDGDISAHNRRHVPSCPDRFVNAGHYLYIYWYWLLTEAQISTLCTVRHSRVRLSSIVLISAAGRNPQYEQHF